MGSYPHGMLNWLQIRVSDYVVFPFKVSNDIRLFGVLPYQVYHIIDCDIVHIYRLEAKSWSGQTLVLDC